MESRFAQILRSSDQAGGGQAHQEQSCTGCKGRVFHSLTLASENSQRRHRSTTRASKQTGKWTSSQAVSQVTLETQPAAL